MSGGVERTPRGARPQADTGEVAELCPRIEHIFVVLARFFLNPDLIVANCYIDLIEFEKATVLSVKARLDFTIIVIQNVF